MIYKYLTLATILITNISLAFSQVTIGNNEAPEKGALLQLKNIDGKTNGEANASKGLGLPKVNLLSTQLDATIYTDLSKTIDGASGNWDKDEHIGLVVYNTSNNATCPGLYVWDGTTWASIGQNGNVALTETMTDADGNTYTAKWFGEDPCSSSNPKGAYWTTENLYSTTNKNGVPFTTGNPYLNPAIYRNPAVGETFEVTSRTALISHSDISYMQDGVLVTKTAIEFAKLFGLLYNHAQSQEACPNGWHLPTQADVDLLISLTQKVSFGLEMRDSTHNSYGGHYNSGVQQWDWLSTPPPTYDYNGFNARPAGFKNEDSGSVIGDVQYFSRIFGFFLSDIDKARWINIELPYNSITPPGIFDQDNIQWINNANYSLSVRCVKD